MDEEEVYRSSDSDNESAGLKPTSGAPALLRWGLYCLLFAGVILMTVGVVGLACSTQIARNQAEKDGVVGGSSPSSANSDSNQVTEGFVHTDSAREDKNQADIAGAAGDRSTSSATSTNLYDNSVTEDSMYTDSASVSNSIKRSGPVPRSSPALAGPDLRSGPASEGPAMKEDASSGPVSDSWLCSQVCQGRREDGCCSYRVSTKQCFFSAGGTLKGNGDDDWQANLCNAAFGASYCHNYLNPKTTCAGSSQPASKNLPRGSSPLARLKPGTLQTLQTGDQLWKLTWSDEFDDKTCKLDQSGILRPNPDMWDYEIGYARGNELQWYQPGNAACRKGNLVITAKQELPKNAFCNKALPNGIGVTAEGCEKCGAPHFQTWWPCDQKTSAGDLICDCQRTQAQPPAWPMNYTSSSMTTKGKFTFNTGMWEMRAKVPVELGSFPAWWACGIWSQDTWPFNGEIDMMESFKSVMRANIIYGCKSKQTCEGSVTRIVDKNWANEFHTWRYVWSEKSLTVTIDGELMISYDQAALDKALTGATNPWMPSHPFFMRLNFAIGGVGGKVKAKFPLEFEVDYLRVYEPMNYSGSPSQAEPGKVASTSGLSPPKSSGLKISPGLKLLAIYSSPLTWILFD